MDMEELMNYGYNLIDFLKDDKDIVGLQHFLRQSKALQSQCDKDFKEMTWAIADYETKIEECKHKVAAVESEIVSDAEIDALEKEMAELQKLECMLEEELRVAINGIDDLELQRASLEEQRQTIKNVEHDESRARMRLGMYASVTNIIPNMDDDPSKISGYIIARDKKVVENFAYDPSKEAAFDICNDIWKIINL